MVAEANMIHNLTMAYFLKLVSSSQLVSQSTDGSVTNTHEPMI